MSLSEYIVRLQSLEAEHGHRHVVVRGYEGGYHSVKDPETFDLALDVNTDWYYGEHEKVYEGDDYSDKVIVPAICLGR